MKAGYIPSLAAALMGMAPEKEHHLDRHAVGTMHGYGYSWQWPHGRAQANHSKYSPRIDTPKSQRNQRAG